jgi:hypothetical protein
MNPFLNSLYIINLFKIIESHLVQGQGSPPPPFDPPADLPFNLPRKLDYQARNGLSTQYNTLFDVPV